MFPNPAIRRAYSCETTLFLEDHHLHLASQDLGYALDVCEEQQVFKLIEAHTALVLLNNAPNHLSSSARVLRLMSTGVTPLKG